MGRWHGNIGFSVRTEVSPDIWKDSIVEHKAQGFDKTLRYNWQNQQSSLLDDCRINVQITVNADKFTMENFSNIKWIEYSGHKYKITSIEPPCAHRINLTLGGLWHEN